MKPLKVILAIICVIIAIYNFDIYNLERTIVAVLLFLNAALLVSQNKKLNRFLFNASIFLAIFLIMKMIFGF